jgi:hypothetical protein
MVASEALRVREESEKAELGARRVSSSDNKEVTDISLGRTRLLGESRTGRNESVHRRPSGGVTGRLAGNAGSCGWPYISLQLSETEISSRFLDATHVGGVDGDRRSLYLGRRYCASVVGHSDCCPLTFCLPTNSLHTLWTVDDESRCLEK